MGARARLGPLGDCGEGACGNCCLIGCWQPPPHLARPTLLLRLGTDLEALLGARDMTGNKIHPRDQDGNVGAGAEGAVFYPDVPVLAYPVLMNRTCRFTREPR